jgi:type II secretory pathway component GspD/PulD (secretin)
MKTLFRILLVGWLAHASLFAAENGASRLMSRIEAAVRREEVRTFSSFDRVEPKGGGTVLPAGAIKFVEADAEMVLNLYRELSGRTVIRAASLPQAKISFQTQTILNRVEVLQALDTVLAEHQIAMILMGTKFVKAVPAAQAHAEGGPVIELPPDQLPDSGSYLVYIVKPKRNNATEVLAMLQPFAKLPNSLVAIKDPGLLILRDYSANVRRMLEVLERIEKEARSR